MHTVLAFQIWELLNHPRSRAGRVFMPVSGRTYLTGCTGVSVRHPRRPACAKCRCCGVHCMCSSSILVRGGARGVSGHEAPNKPVRFSVPGDRSPRNVSEKLQQVLQSTFVWQLLCEGGALLLYSTLKELGGRKPKMRRKKHNSS